MNLQALDDRLKVALCTGTTVAAAFMAAPVSLLALAGFWLLLWHRTGLPLGSLRGRLGWLVPVAVSTVLWLPFFTPGRPLLHWGWVAVTVEGLHRALLLTLRLGLAALVMSLLTATTPPLRLTAALRALHLPSFLVSMVGFVLRYVELLAEEVGRMQTARCSRGARGGPGLQEAGALAGALLLRALDRAEGVHLAMRSRGYRGHDQVQAAAVPGLRQWVHGAAVAVPAALILLLDRGVIPWPF